MDLKDLQQDPFKQFSLWFEEASACSAITYPEAMCVSSIGLDRYPDSRMVLMKEHGPEGFVFYTNLLSSKGKSLQSISRVALNFYWMPLGRQVRIRGDAKVISGEKADAYFKTRPRGSQLGAWASKQSEELASRDELLQRLAVVEKKFVGKEVDRPPHWLGFVIQAKELQFWLQQDSRLHDCFLYQKENGDDWKITRRNP